MTRWSCLVLALALAVVPVTAQAQGTIQGTVRSEDTGVGLGNARIELPALGRVAYSGATGDFTIPGVPAGTHTLEVRLLGMGLQTLEVTVASGQTASIEIQATETPRPIRVNMLRFQLRIE